MGRPQEHNTLDLISSLFQAFIGRGGNGTRIDGPGMGSNQGFGSRFYLRDLS